MPSERAPETKSFKQLLAAWREAVVGTDLARPPAYEGPDVTLTALVEHTDAVAPGACFVARVRPTGDGHPYIGRALARGASLIVGQEDRGQLQATFPDDVPYVRVPDTALAMAWLAAAWEGFPGKELVVVGITGTDGKTTTANFLHQILQAAGRRAGLLSTLQAVVGDVEEALPLHVTTPEAPIVQRYLRRMVDAGLTHCVLEATSHGLAQQRVAAVDFDVAVITNVTHEHVDYHGSHEEYVAAKARLFEALGAGPGDAAKQTPTSAPPKTAVLNGDDSSFARFAAIPASRQITYAIQQEADVRADNVRTTPEGTRFDLQMAGQTRPVQTPFVGRFNVYNMLASAAAAYALGLGPGEIGRGLQSLSPLGGRMERVDEGQPFLTLVDFAHTPNALARAIGAARHMAQGKIITVFGSAGERDVQKRRLMAEIAAREADLTVFTAEDPRTEPLSEILESMARGARSEGAEEGKTFWRVPDRGQAIYQALTLAEPGDLVLICGKGHEQSMCFGKTEFPWDDRAAARTALRAWQEGRPMPDLGLPTYEAD